MAHLGKHFFADFWTPKKEGGCGPGERASARVDLNDVVTMVRWTAVERPVRPEPPGPVRAIVIDPKSGLIEER